MKAVDRVLAVVERPTPHCLCLGLSVCETLCLQLYTTDALLIAEREVDTMRPQEAASRLRAEIVRRYLLAPRSDEALTRLDQFLSRFYPERDRLREAVRRAIGRPAAPSAIWSSEGQKFVRELAAVYADDSGFVREALKGLQLEQGEHVASVPIVVSVRHLIAPFHTSVRERLRAGLCLRFRVEYDPDVTAEPLVCSEQLRAAAATALRFAAKDEGAPPGRVIVEAPAVARHVPIEGGSLALPLYRAFRYLFASQEPPADIALTGAIDEAGRVTPVGGLDEKSRAAVDAGIGCLFYPAPEASGKSDGGVAVAIEERAAAAFLREVEKSATPRHVRIANWLKVGLFIGLFVAWVATIRIWNVFYIPPASVQSAFKELVPWQLVGEAPFIGIGVPLQLLLLLQPFLILLLVYLIMARQLECWVNWRRRGRWEPGLQPGERDAAVVAAHRRSAHELAIRRAFRFTLGWFCWSVGLTGTMLCFGLAKTISDLRVGTGLLGWVARIAMALGWLALVFAVPASVLWLYRRVRALAEARFPSLK